MYFCAIVFVILVFIQIAFLIPEPEQADVQIEEQELVTNVVENARVAAVTQTSMKASNINVSDNQLSFSTEGNRRKQMEIPELGNARAASDVISNGRGSVVSSSSAISQGRRTNSIISANVRE